MEDKGHIKRSKSVEWETPQDLYDELDGEYCFTLDPCATAENAKCEKFYTKEDNGLEQSWKNERVFMNPPYGKHEGLWLEKAFNEYRVNGVLTVALLPVKTGTKRWWNYVHGIARVRFLRGRLKFGGAKHNAPFDSCVVIWGK